MIYAFAAAWFFAASGFPLQFASRPARTLAREVAGVAGAVGGAVDAAGNAVESFRGGEPRAARECEHRRKAIVGALALYLMENSDPGTVDVWTLVAGGYLRDSLSCPTGCAYRIETRGIRRAVLCDAHGYTLAD